MSGLFDVARSFCGGRLNQLQVDVINAVMDESRRLKWLDHRWTAYALATAFHETGPSSEERWTPVEENLSYSAKRIGEVWPRLANRAAELERRPQALAEAAYGGRLGNGPEGSGDGWLFRGRGIAQITGRANYRNRGAEIGLPLEDQPEMALQPDVAVVLLCGPMARGGYTNKKLSDFFSGNKDDPVGARAIINGDVAENGRKVAETYAALLATLSGQLPTAPEHQPENDRLAAIEARLAVVEAKLTAIGAVAS